MKPVAQKKGLSKGSQCQVYRKIIKIWDTRKFAVITLKVEQDDFTLK